MKWLLIIFILVDGDWMAADYAVEGWKPSEYATEAACKDVLEIAEAVELRMQEEHRDHYRLKDRDGQPGMNPHVMILPKKYECRWDGNR